MGFVRRHCDDSPVDALMLTEESEAFRVTLQMVSAPFWNIGVGGGKQEKYVAMLRKSMDSDETVVSSEKLHLSMGQ